MITSAVIAIFSAALGYFAAIWKDYRDRKKSYRAALKQTYIELEWCLHYSKKIVRQVKEAQRIAVTRGLIPYTEEPHLFAISYLRHTQIQLSAYSDADEDLLKGLAFLINSMNEVNETLNYKPVMGVLQHFDELDKGDALQRYFSEVLSLTQVIQDALPSVLKGINEELGKLSGTKRLFIT